MALKIFFKLRVCLWEGTSSPILADLYLSWLEFQYMNKLIKSDYHRAKLLSSNCRYLDDIVTPNFNDCLLDSKLIYPNDLVLEANKTDDSNDNIRDHFQDLDISINKDTFCFNVYNKVDSFNFKVISFPFAKSCIPTNIGYNTFYSQLVRYLNICSTVKYFQIKTKVLVDLFINHGYRKFLLNKYF